MIAPRTPVELVRSSRLASAPYAYAAVAHDVSRLIFTAGACPLDESGAIVAVGDVVGQTERVMTNLRIALQAADTDLPMLSGPRSTSPVSVMRTCSPPGRW